MKPVKALQYNILLTLRRPLWIFYVFCLVFALPLCSSFICALWSPAGKGLTSWLSFVVSNCEFVTFPSVDWERDKTQEIIPCKKAKKSEVSYFVKMTILYFILLGSQFLFTKAIVTFKEILEIYTYSCFPKVLGGDFVIIIYIPYTYPCVCNKHMLCLVYGFFCSYTSDMSS